uniref:Serpin family B member 1 n=1 Tax=Neolamprologus brichardi TaxID=32507 RepID=A0A3Q4HZW8_NEOBR
MSAVSSSNTAFALELFRTLSQANSAGNIFVSPLSISSALAMVYLGAKGDTAAQMAQVSTLSLVTCTMINFQMRLMCVTTAQTNHGLLLESLSALKYSPNRMEYMDTNLERLTYIFVYVNHQGPLIKDLLKPGTVRSNTRLALVNAIYFKGNWRNPFDEANTQEMPFKNETVPVQMMYQMKKLPYNYIHDHGLQILELPYVNEELSMFVLLPAESSDGSDPLLKLEKELTQERLNEWTDRKNMDVDSEVVLHLPKFKLVEDYELNEPLTKLGMKNVFCAGSADLSGMNGEGGLFLSTVAHKAFVEVNEEGTEAAAATAGMIAFCMLREEHFRADHPFLFFIRHNKTKSILFFGRFSSPQ